MHDNSCNKTGSEGKDELHNADPSAHLDELVNVAEAGYAVWFNSTRALHGEKDARVHAEKVAFCATSSVSEVIRLQVIVMARDGSD